MKKNYQRSVYTKNDAGNIFLFALVFPPILLAALLVFVLPFIKNLTEETQSTLLSVFSIISAQIGLLIIFLLYNKVKGFKVKKASRISFKLNFLNIIIAIVIGLVVLYGFGNLISVFDELFFKLFNHPSTELPLPLNNAGWLIANLLLLAVLPAICEELIFRGVIFNGLKQYGKKTAIVVSALLFALLHTNIEQTVYPILFGIVLAYIVFKTDNVFYAIIAHFVNNAIVVVFNFLVNINVLPADNSTFVLNAESVLGAVAYCIITFGAVWLLTKFLKKNKQENNLLVLEDLPNFENDESFEKFLTEENHQTLTGANKKTWERIFCQRNDLLAIESANKKKNTLLWVGVVISLVLWFVSI